MSDKQLIMCLLYLLDDSSYIEMFHVVEDSGIRKAGLRISKVTGYHEVNEYYKVIINRSILKRWLKLPEE